MVLPPTEPTVAVVIPTHNRPELLRRCLQALTLQTRAPDAVIVVDDHSSPPAAAVVGEFAHWPPLELLVSDRTSGPGQARDRAWRRTSADYIAFTDDDCRPSSGWVAALMSGAAPRHIVVGRVQPDPQDGAPSSVLDRSMLVDSDDGRFSTCNVLYPRALLEELGGFDADFPLPYGEDTDLGQRALEAGATSSFAADALVEHAMHHLTLRNAVRDRLRLREMPQLVRRHPHLRYATCSGRFVRDSHRSLLFGIAGLGVLPLGRFGLRSSRRWIDDAIARVPPQLRHGRRLSQQVALLAALDTVELAACARGSVRSRTLLL